MKRALMTGCAVAAAAAVAVVPASGSAQPKSKTKTTVTIEYHTGAAWVGYVKSTKKACKDKRKVTIYDGNQKVVSGKSYFVEETYAYVLDDPDPEAGTYTAEVKTTGECKGDTSKPFHYPEDNLRR